jgi:transposase InsO family protein
MTERERLVRAHLAGLYSVTELARQFGVSRKTVYKWIDRAEHEGLLELRDHSRAPLNHPNEFADQEVIQRVLSLRQEHPTWGPRTVRNRLLKQAPELDLPAVSTIGAWFKRQGLIIPRKRRQEQARQRSRRPTIEATAPNARWDLDFKGDFLLGNTERCYPLTLTDGYSRLILTIDALPSTAFVGAHHHLERTFRQYGLPTAIRSDNGVPFAPGGGGPGLSRLGVWLIRLGVYHERTRPGSPQDNGRHERMHRTLKAETARPPQQTMSAQQQRFDEFRRDFNEDRPHQGINDQTPSSIYTPSERSYPSTLPLPEYPGHWEKRMVHRQGYIRFKACELYVSTALAGLPVGLNEIDDQLWSLRFFEHELGRLDEATMQLSLAPLR